IRFRFDEKRFDVDGAYNVRYEIMKKRIDKAVVLGTTERLTQPGKIAIVYSQAAEAAEYRDYIAYLQAQGYLQGEVEKLELEERQAHPRVHREVRGPRHRRVGDRPPPVGARSLWKCLARAAQLAGLRRRPHAHGQDRHGDPRAARAAPGRARQGDLDALPPLG